MKLTAKQHDNIARGMRRIEDAVVMARFEHETGLLLRLLGAAKITGTFYSKRFKK